MSDGDRLYRFLFDGADVRGELVQLGELYRDVVGRAEHPEGLARLVGEGLAATSLLLATLKFSGSLTLQIQADGPLKLLVIQAGSDGSMRALARADGEDLPDLALDQQAPNGALAITIDADDQNNRYQGVVDLAAGSLAGAIEKYFRESEQLDTRVWLSADADVAAGLLLQRLPASERPSDEVDDDAWDRVGHLAATLTGDELRNVAPTSLLYRLFHEETVRLFDPFPLRFRCRCADGRIDNVINSMGADDARALLAEEGQIEVTCQFCSTVHRYDPVDVEAIFAAPADRHPPSDESH
jgi:molecular chaperone Hsp33